MNYTRYGKRFAMMTLLTGTLLVQGVPSAQAGSSKTSIEPLLMIPSGAEVPGTGSILVRTKEGVSATLHIAGLTPGHVYTLWFTVFNNPKRCATTPCTPADLSNPDVQGVILSGAGQIAGEDGTVDLGAFRAVGDPSGKAEGQPATAEALEKPFKAQIHLAIRSHGLASTDPAVLQQQLTTFNGGCAPTCMTVQAAPHLPER